MSEWEEDFWDPTQGVGSYDEDPYEDKDEEPDDESFGGEPQEESLEPDIAGRDEDIEFEPDFKQLQQTSYERGAGLKTVGLSAGQQKAQRTPEEAAIDQVQGVLASSYQDLSEDKKRQIVAVAERTKNIYLLNVEVFVLAALWIDEGSVLDTKNFQNFVKIHAGRSEVDQVDLLRYIRMLQL